MTDPPDPAREALVATLTDAQRAHRVALDAVNNASADESAASTVLEKAHEALKTYDREAKRKLPLTTVERNFLNRVVKAGAAGLSLGSKGSTAIDPVRDLARALCDLGYVEIVYQGRLFYDVTLTSAGRRKLADKTPTTTEGA